MCHGNIPRTTASTDGREGRWQKERKTVREKKGRNENEMEEREDREKKV